MATWEDGPEYAPVERPEQFDGPDVAPLDSPPPFSQPAAQAPKDRPQFSDPDAPVAPLATLVPADSGEERDPTEPFAVVSSTLTTSLDGPSAWGSAHGSRLGGPGSPGDSGPGGARSWAPPGGTPVSAGSGSQVPLAEVGAGMQNWPPPDQPMVLTAGAPMAQNGFPAPGTTGWFGFPGAQPAPPPAGPPDVAQLGRAVTAPVIIFLLLSVIYPLAPITFIVAFALSTRIRVGRSAVLRSFWAAAGAIFLFTLIFYFGTDSGGYTVLSLCAFFFSLVELVVVSLLVWRELKKGPPANPYGGGPQYPPYGSPWG